jgi:osmoprotectant transport system ATP-binding protein
VIRLDGLSRTFSQDGREVVAVRDLSLEVRTGECLCLIGESGCGKTTTLRLINRLLEPSSGRVLVDGEDTAEVDPIRLRRRMGYVVQRGALFPHLTVRENVGLLCRLEGWPGERREARVDELLGMVRMPAEEFAERYPSELSGGQRQRVGVARALAADPPLMLMDEPFGAIDPINRERLQNEFLRLQAELRKTIVFVTHDIDEAIKMGDRIAVLQEGGILAQYASPAELLMYPANPFVEDFVGSDRALKRLALQRVRDVDLWKAPLVRVGEPTSEARAKLEASEVRFPLLVDADNKPIGWLSERGLAGERVREELRSGPEPVVELDDVLRDALSDLLGNEAQYGPVVDKNGSVAGVLSIELLSHAIVATSPEDVPTSADLA